MLRYIESQRLKEGVGWYTLDGALETYKRFTDFQDFARDRCGCDDQLLDDLIKVGKRIEELIKIRNTKEFSHNVSEEKVNLPDGDYKAFWHGIYIEFEVGAGLRIKINHWDYGLDIVHDTENNPKK